jgi:hypothetical protein
MKEQALNWNLNGSFGLKAFRYKLLQVFLEVKF